MHLKICLVSMLKKSMYLNNYCTYNTIAKKYGSICICIGSLVHNSGLIKVNKLIAVSDKLCSDRHKCMGKIYNSGSMQQ